MSERLRLRPGVNVPDELERNRIVKWLRKIRADAVLDKNTWEHWNRLHPDEPQLDTGFEDALIAWCDGRGPLPPEAQERLDKIRRGGTA